MPDDIPRPLTLCLGWLGRHAQRVWESSVSQGVRKPKDSSNYCDQGVWKPSLGQVLAVVSGQRQCLEASNPIEYRWQGPMHHTDPGQGRGLDVSSLDLDPGNTFSLRMI